VEDLAVILDGRATASEVMEELGKQAEALRGKGVTPTLALILVGDDRYSRRYVNMKVKRAEGVGVATQLHHLQEATQEELLNLVKGLSGDPSIHGIMVQLPLPEGYDELSTVEAIAPKKDVDGLNPATLGKLLMGEDCFPPAAVEAIMELLNRHNIDPEGKHWVIVGLSNIVGKPLAALLTNLNVAATCLQVEQENLTDYTKEADVLMVDVARKWAVTAEMVKEGAVVLDNGNNYEGRKVFGDVDFEVVKEVASAITPVPGGIGPLLIAMLIRNTLKAAESSV
jgi:methylenetetrahydrofolate dehydrogenase (NADP+)/methenyltetrahydrofolate cyclohydrolase